MIRRALTVLLAASAALTFGASAAAAHPARPTPLPQAHAHNDYEHERPLLDALSHGFTSVEADIYLEDGELRVGHDPEDLIPGRTLQSLYLDPLARRPHRVQLLVDIKNTGAATYTELDRVLRGYRKILTTYRNGRVIPGPVTVVISGDRPRDLMQSQRVRYAFYDGRSADLNSGARTSFIPLISDNWTTLFTWQGAGPFPAAERAKLRKFVHDAHRNNQRVRFWATPDTPGPARDAVWRELLTANVDHINTDDLSGLEKFLRNQKLPRAA